MEYWSGGVMRITRSHYSIIPLLCSTNQPPVLIEWPVNKQATPDEIFFRHRTPITAVVAVVAIVAQGKITVRWHGERTIWICQIITARAVAAIRGLRLHHPGESITVCFFSIDVEKRRIDAQTITGRPGQSLNVKRRPRLGILPNSRDVICSEDKNVAPVRFNEVIAKFIHKHLIAGVHGASGNNFAAAISPSGENFEIMTERVR